MVSRTTTAADVSSVPGESAVQPVLRVPAVPAELAEQRNELMSMVFFRVKSVLSQSVLRY